MKKWILSSCVLIMVTGCSTPPEKPQPNNDKYTFQCIKLTYREGVVENATFNLDTNVASHIYLQPTEETLFDKDHSYTASQVQPLPFLYDSQVEKLMDKADIETVEFPIVCAGLGESVTNDQTETKAMAVDAEVVDGKVIYTKEPYKFGEYISITVHKAEGYVITYNIDMMIRKFKGFDEYKTKEELTIEMPCFESRSINSEITQPTDVWTILGGFVCERDNGEKMNEIIITRIIPPS